MYAIPLIAKSAMNGAQFRAQRVGNAGGGLIRKTIASPTKHDAVMEFYGLPPIGQKQRRPMDGAQFHDIPGPQKRGTGGTLIIIRIESLPSFMRGGSETPVRDCYKVLRYCVKMMSYFAVFKGVCSCRLSVRVDLLAGGVLEATADLSTTIGAKCAPIFAQDDNPFC
jgi:hypothetical protein